MILGIRVMAVGLGVLALTACEESRVISARGGLEGIPGATGGYTGGAPGVSSGRTFESILGDPEEDGDIYDTSAEDSAGFLRKTNEDGTVRLVSHSPRHLLYHLSTTLMSGEHELLYEQLLSTKTKQAYLARGKDPHESISWMVRNEAAIRELLMTLPAGEATPGVLQETIGPNEFRLRSPSAFAMKLPYHTIDVVIEDRSFKLLMIR